MNFRLFFKSALLLCGLQTVSCAQAQYTASCLPGPQTSTTAVNAFANSSAARPSKKFDAAAISKADRSKPVLGSADKLSSQSDQTTVLEGNATLSRGTVTVTGDLITYFQISDEVLLESISPEGPARVLRQVPGGVDVLTTPKARLRLEDNTGYAQSPEVFYSRVNGRGKADYLENLPDQKSRLINAQYTTCAPGDDSWILKARTILIDQSEDVGTARGAVLYFKNTPILGTPYFQFPLGKERRTGFLPASLGLSSRTGVDITTPYYINLAPNRDLTLEPRLMSKRGLQLGGEFRYLAENYRGDARVEWLPNDTISGEQRYYLQARHNWSRAGWAGGYNLQSASDDRYFVDLSKSISNVSNTSLPRDLFLSYTQPLWSVTGRFSSFQTLQDPVSPVPVPFDRLPQLSFSYIKPSMAGFDMSVNAEVTRFSRPALPLGILPSPEGWRSYVQPSVSYPIVRPAFFAIPKLSVHATRYWGLHQDDGQYNGPTAFNRILPIFSIDSGLNLERDQGLLFSQWKQTLEPRLFYLRVPYKNQSKFPIFDTALTDFGFGQLFSENVFSGQDRIADANQLTLAATTRYLDPVTNEDRLRLAIGKRFYFTQPRVENTQAPQSKSSDLLLSASGPITRTLTLDSTLQLNTESNRLVRSVIGLRYNPAERKLLNLAYRYTRGANAVETSELLDLSGQWQLRPRWYLVGRVNYSLPERRISEAVAGVEYDACCWRVRTFLNRYAVATQKATTSLFIQLELVGLGSIGNDPLALLKRSVPGYRKLESPDTWNTAPY
mgnify:CR=1 FL=1